MLEAFRVVNIKVSSWKEGVMKEYRVLEEFNNISYFIDGCSGGLGIHLYVFIFVFKKNWKKKQCVYWMVERGLVICWEI